MTDRYVRVKPLGTCPHASCGRGKLAAGKACLKTHFATRQDWQNFMIARFNDLDRLRDALGKLTEEEQWNLNAMYNALDWRITDRRIKEPTVH